MFTSIPRASKTRDRSSRISKIPSKKPAGYPETPKLNRLVILEYLQLGNGITVVDTNRQYNNDYLKVAHITIYREVTIYDNSLSNKYINAIHHYAKTANPKLSVCQNFPVFITS